MLLIWLQVSVLAAVSVAISTRFSFVVSLPAVLLIYLAGNLTRFIDPALAATTSPDGTVGRIGPIYQVLGQIVQTILPYLSAFDLRNLTVYATVKLPGTSFAQEQGVTLGQIWAGTGIAAVYALLYAVAALGVGMLLFRDRELGGAEG
jgi:hypothetical protein